jgi:hypothetical protein
MADPDVGQDRDVRADEDVVLDHDGRDVLVSEGCAFAKVRDDQCSMTDHDTVSDTHPLRVRRLENRVSSDEHACPQLDAPPSVQPDP